MGYILVGIISASLGVWLGVGLMAVISYNRITDMETLLREKLQEDDLK